MIDINSFYLQFLNMRETEKRERGEDIFYDIHLRTQSRDNIVLIDGDKPSDLAAVLA